MDFCAFLAATREEVRFDTTDVCRKDSALPAPTVYGLSLFSL